MNPQPGLYPGIPMREYLEIDAIGSSRLEWLAVSPLHYKYMLTQPAEETDALARGTALHMAVLEPQSFITRYALEPDVAAIGGAKPRATNAYRDQVAAIEKGGQIVLKTDEMARVLGMAESVRRHPHAARVLARAPEREVSAVWSRGERLCRGRFDMLGDGVIADLKTTRSLASFNPWTITKLGYYRAAAHYLSGARSLDVAAKHFLIVAVESAPPYDIGVFALEEDVIAVGQAEVDALLRRLDACELADDWPGMFPTIQRATLTDAAAIELAATEEE